jgi:hypothetical protein
MTDKPSGSCDHEAVITTPRSRTVALLLACGSFFDSGCDWIQDRFRSCGHLRVDLVNSDQTLSQVSILAEDEQEKPETVLASGASRRISICVEKGDIKKFRALKDGEVLAVANCVVSKSRYQYEASLAKVVWTPIGFLCEEW